MIGLGTLINCACIVGGGLVGVVVGGRLKDNIKDILIKTSGLAALFIGLSGTLAGLMSVGSDGVTLVTGKSLLLIASLVIGGAAGELIGIEKHICTFGAWLRRKARREGDNRFIEAFVNTSLVVCVGAMAIVGSLEDGISGDISMLVAKSVMDAVFVLAFSSAHGAGAVFSAVPVFILQGTVTLLAVFISPLVTGTMIMGMSFVGSVLIFCVGVNNVFDKHLKVGNMLPAILVPVLWEALCALYALITH